ncbi:MAG: uracil-DNA glycosylase [Gemmatimonadetes bacterium]|nr:uracil-DNA glycosylase [Gemmatimonadota bacterium]
MGEGTVVLGTPQTVSGPKPEQSVPEQRAVPQAVQKASPKWLKGAPSIPSQGIVIPAPPKDLFTSDPLSALGLGQIAERIGQCRACSLCDGRQKTVPGEGAADARLVVVGEGPGATEDETGRPFVGRAGELLTEILLAIDLPRERVFICNVVKCRPPANRKPLPAEIAACVPYLYRQLEVVRPAVILAMGGTAAETLLNTKQPLSQLREHVHEFRGIPVVVTYHPAALLRNPHWKKPTWDDVRIARRILDAR